MCKLDDPISILLEYLLVFHPLKSNFPSNHNHPSTSIQATATMKFTFALAIFSLALSVSASGGGGGPDLYVPILLSSFCPKAGSLLNPITTLVQLFSPLSFAAHLTHSLSSFISSPKLLGSCKNVPVCTAGRRRSLGLTTLPRAWLNAVRGVPAVEVGTSVEVAASKVDG